VPGLRAGGTRAAVCRECGAPLTVRARQQRLSRDLADRIAASTSDRGYAEWQRTVITDVVHGGGTAGYALVISTVVVCAAVFLGVHRAVLAWWEPANSPGIFVYLAVVVPLTVLYFRLRAPLFYRLHRLSERKF
jgi:hypothetical protein